MFLRKYLNEFYFDLLLEEYEESYLETIDENQFAEIYNLFIENNFYFVNDVIIKYLEIFNMDSDIVKTGLSQLKKQLGTHFVYLIGDDMRYLETILNF